MRIPRCKMNELDAEYRSHSRKEEVNQGLNERASVDGGTNVVWTAPTLLYEGCPVGINIPRFIKNIERGEFLEAAKTLKENQCTACRLRSCMSTGKTVRIKMYPSENGQRSRSHWLSGKFCC